jgi:uncharacterized membrane protein YccC
LDLFHRIFLVGASFAATLDGPVAAASSASSSESVPRWFEDVPIRQGIKMALGGMLAFYCALWLQLDNPGWCIFTVVVLTIAQYVGAIAEKSLLRAIGTGVGAFLGLWLVGVHGDERLFVMGGSFLIAAVGTMMFGGNRYPYAFFLSALTTLVVVNSSMKNPSAAWPTAVARVEEIFIGILASMVVTSVIWPRYARVEFRKNYRSALRDVGRIAIARSRRLLDCDLSDETEKKVHAVEASFATRMNTLRLLIRYGQRESEYFRAKLPIRMRMIGELGACFEAATSLGQRLPQQSRYRDLITGELKDLHEQLDREFDELVEKDAVEPINLSLRETIDRCNSRMDKLREQGATRQIPIQEAMDFSAHYTALLDIAARLKIIRESLHAIHSTLEVLTPKTTGEAEPFRLDPFWIRNGIKGGLAAVIALTLVNWINPPGGSAIPFAAWLFTSMSRTYPGGEGDRRAFTAVIRVALIGIPYSLLLLVITPFLADYLLMNVFLFTGLFALGFAIAKQGGISLYAQCGMLFFVGAIGMNLQMPVSFQQIAGTYFGVVVALVLSSVIQRMLWPTLPQRQICTLFAEYFSCCRALLDPVDDKEFNRLQDRIALIPPEAASWIRVTTTPEYPAGETRRLLDLLHSAERLGYSILSARKLAQLDIPAEILDHLAATLQAVEKGSRETLQALEEAFAHGRCGQLPDSQLAVFKPMEGPLAEMRQRYLSGELNFPQAIPYLGAMDFLEDTARTLDRCVAQLRGLKLEAYSGDYAL